MKEFIQDFLQIICFLFLTWILSGGFFTAGSRNELNKMKWVKELKAIAEIWVISLVVNIAVTEILFTKVGSIIVYTIIGLCVLSATGIYFLKEQCKSIIKQD